MWRFFRRFFFLFVIVGGFLWFVVDLWTPFHIQRSAQVSLINAGLDIEPQHVAYSPFDLIQTGMIHAMVLEGADLAQLSPPESLPRVKRIIFRDAKVRADFLQEAPLDFKVNAHLTRDRLGDGVDIQGDMVAEGLNIEVRAKINGHYKDPENWHIFLDLQRSRFDMGRIKIARAHGDIKLQPGENAPVVFDGQITAGGLTYYGLPWKNVSISFKGSPAQYVLSSTGQSHSEALEFSITQNVQGGVIDLAGSVFAKSYKDALEYAQEYDFPFSRVRKGRVKNSDAVMANFEMVDFSFVRAQKNFKYQLKKDSKVIDNKNIYLLRNEYPYFSDSPED